MDPDIPVIVMAAFGECTRYVVAMDVGAADYLNKPVRCQDFLLTIRMALARRRNDPGRGHEEGATGGIGRRFQFVGPRNRSRRCQGTKKGRALMGKRVVVLSVAVLFLSLTVAGAPASAAVRCGEPVLAPKHQAGEKWTWRDEQGREWSEAVQAEGDLTQMKWANGDVAYHDKDLVTRMVSRPNGQVITKQGAGLYTAVGVKTIDFPLQVGNGWEYNSIGQAIRGGRGTLTSFWYVYKVVACEDVSTPAGKFPAFKVEVTESYGDRALTSTGPLTHGVYHLWYAPQVKNYVKLHYEPMTYWIGPAFRDYDLIKFEVK